MVLRCQLDRGAKVLCRRREFAAPKALIALALGTFGACRDRVLPVIIAIVQRRHLGCGASAAAAAAATTATASARLLVAGLRPRVSVRLGGRRGVRRGGGSGRSCGSRRGGDEFACQRKQLGFLCDGLHSDAMQLERRLHLAYAP